MKRKPVPGVRTVQTQFDQVLACQHTFSRTPAGTKPSISPPRPCLRRKGQPRHAGRPSAGIYRGSASSMHVSACQTYQKHFSFDAVLTAIGIARSTVFVSLERTSWAVINLRHSAISIFRRLPLQRPTSCTIIKAWTSPMSAIFRLFSSNYSDYQSAAKKSQVGVIRRSPYQV